MGKSRKPAGELTREEIAKRVFPTKVVDEAKKIVEKQAGKSS